MLDQCIAAVLPAPVFAIGAGAGRARRQHAPLGAPGHGPQPHRGAQGHEPRPQCGADVAVPLPYRVGLQHLRGRELGAGLQVPGRRGVERGVGQVERRVAVAGFLQIDQHGAAVAADQEVAGVAVEGDQPPRRACAALAQKGKVGAHRIDRRTGAGDQRSGVEVGRLGLDFGAQRGQRVGGVEQGRAFGAGRQWQ